MSLKIILGIARLELNISSKVKSYQRNIRNIWRYSESLETSLDWHFIFIEKIVKHFPSPNQSYYTIKQLFKANNYNSCHLSWFCIFHLMWKWYNISWSILTYSVAFINMVNIFGLDCEQAAPDRPTNIYFLGNTKIQAVHIFLYLYCLQNVMCS